MLRFEDFTLECDVIETESFIPDIKSPDSHPFFTCDESVDREEAERIGGGMIHTILPYKMQNYYGKQRKKRVFKAAVLENDYIKATFLPELGGRLWSLYHKKQKRDLVYENGSLKISNLALCNAWFAGGVEWNVGMKGHSPFTCRPLFTRKCKGKLGNDVLRMYEYEEIRGTSYSVEATLDGEDLLVKVRIKNTRDKETYTYWWSNIAVAEKGTQVLVPADKTYVTSYRDGGYSISRIDVTEEMSHPLNTRDAKDYFYDIPKNESKWIAALDKDGIGLLHSSDDLLQGRKTFLWGTGRGGRHWNSQLTDRGDYIEIQAGLCKTQFEHLLLAPLEEISFIESYSLVDIGGISSYADAVSNLKNIAAGKKRDADLFEISEEDKLEIIGSARGYLAEILHGRPLLPGLEFPRESVSKEFAYYENLLRGAESLGDEGTGFVCDEKYKELILKKNTLTAFDCYALSLIDYAAGKFDTAIDYIERSLEISEEFYSLSAAALLSLNVKKDARAAYSYGKRAMEMKPNDFFIACLYAELCSASGNHEKFIEYYNNADEEMRKEGRIRLYVGRCLIALNRIEEAERFINKDLSIPDLREGEYSTVNLWIEMYRKKIASARGISADSISNEQVIKEYPIPYEIDYRMH